MASRFTQGSWCKNGHEITDDITSGQLTPRCSECGEESIVACESCKAALRGRKFDPDGWGGSWRMDRAVCCYNCGAQHPWTKREADAAIEVIGLLDQLNAEETKNLQEALPDIMTVTPRTNLAIVLFKQAAAKVSDVMHKLFVDVVTKVAAESIRMQIFPPR